MTASTTTFTSRTVPWMKIGAQIDDPHVTAAEAARLGGIDFDVEVRRSAFEGSAPKTWAVVPTRFGLVRGDTNTFFDFVSDDYKVVQYREAFEFMNTINPLFVAAGALKGGRQGFIVVQFPDHLTIDPEPNGQSDPHDLYVILRTSHDRSKALEVAIMPLRNACMNQLGLSSMTANVPQRWSIKHVGDPKAKLTHASEVLNRTERYSEIFSNTVRQLASVRVTVDDLRYVMRRVLPDRPMRADQITAIENAFTDSPYVGFNDTGWGAVNAVSDYFEHGREGGSRTQQSRFTGGLDGQTAKYVRRTAQLILNRA